MVSIIQYYMVHERIITTKWPKVIGVQTEQ